ncbi:unnamed protein product [Rhodiola kirilowii]
MELDGNGGHLYRSASGSNISNSHPLMYFSATNIVRSHVSAMLEFMREMMNHREAEDLVRESAVSNNVSSRVHDSDETSNGDQIAIRIVGAGEQELDSYTVGQGRNMGGQNQIPAPQVAELVGRLTPSGSQTDMAMDSDDGTTNEGSPRTSYSDVEGEISNGVGGASNRDTLYQRHYIQQATRWVEQVLPFFLLLLLIFIRQHLHGFFIIIWIFAVMFKSNDIIKKQTSLKGEKNTIVLTCYAIIFMVHLGAVHWWYWYDNLIYPMVLIPPKAVPPFWHAVFIIMVNDILVRQAAMVLKCILLIYYKNSKASNFQRQGQMLTAVEYGLVLYRAVLPAPVWYRFFLNKEYGGLFSSLMTGLYLTFKLTSIVEKVQFFVASLKALSQKEVHYGAYATSDQVIAAGDMCTICQEKMRSPILLCCKHVFCEECVSEWFERERTCPLCRALVKPTDLVSFADGSTSLLFQLF